MVKIYNEGFHKVITILGVNFKFKSSKLMKQHGIPCNSFFENVFSVKNIYIHKVITILGIKLKFKSKKLIEQKKWKNLNDKLNSLIVKQEKKYNKIIKNLNNKNIQIKTILNYYLDNIQKNNLRQNTKVVYTCITGDYDTLIQHDYVNSNYDYICFTDNENLLQHNRLGIWQIKPLVYSNSNNVLNNRWHKLFPHKFLNEYDSSIYVDGNGNIVSSFIFDIITDSTTDMILPKHYKNDCLFDELDYILKSKKDILENMNKLKELYTQEQIPRHLGLSENNIIYRTHDNNKIQNVMEDWWTMLNTYSQRDQASFVYVLWKNGLDIKNYMLIENARFDTKNFKFRKHK